MNTFPLEINKHIIFCIIGFVFFMFQFFRQGFRYQVMTAFAIAATLLLHINDSTAWRYGVGILELILIIAIFIVMTIEKKKAEQKPAAAAASETSENVETDDSQNEKSDTSQDGEGNDE